MEFTLFRYEILQFLIGTEKSSHQLLCNQKFMLKRQRMTKYNVYLAAQRHEKIHRGRSQFLSLKLKPHKSKLFSRNI